MGEMWTYMPSSFFRSSCEGQGRERDREGYQKDGVLLARCLCVRVRVHACEGGGWGGA